MHRPGMHRSRVRLNLSKLFDIATSTLRAFIVAADSEVKLRFLVQERL